MHSSTTTLQSQSRKHGGSMSSLDSARSSEQTVPARQCFWCSSLATSGSYMTGHAGRAPTFPHVAWMSISRSAGTCVLVFGATVESEISLVSCLLVQPPQESGPSS